MFAREEMPSKELCKNFFSFKSFCFHLQPHDVFGDFHEGHSVYISPDTVVTLMININVVASNFTIRAKLVRR
jgi:hypothetical protein